MEIILILFVGVIFIISTMRVLLDTPQGFKDFIIKFFFLDFANEIITYLIKK